MIKKLIVAYFVIQFIVACTLIYISGDNNKVKDDDTIKNKLETTTKKQPLLKP